MVATDGCTLWFPHTPQDLYRPLAGVLDEAAMRELVSKEEDNQRAVEDVVNKTGCDSCACWIGWWEGTVSVPTGTLTTLTVPLSSFTAVSGAGALTTHNKIVWATASFPLSATGNRHFEMVSTTAWNYSQSAPGLGTGPLTNQYMSLSGIIPVTYLATLVQQAVFRCWQDSGGTQTWTVLINAVDVCGCSLVGAPC